MLDEIEKVAAAREKATPGDWRFNGVNSKPKLFGWMHEKDAVFAEGAANLDWPRLVARMRALEAVEKAGRNVSEAHTVFLVAADEGSPMYDVRVHRTAARSLKEAHNQHDAALEAAKEAG
jgi:hypothetical protein